MTFTELRKLEQELKREAKAKHRKPSTKSAKPDKDVGHNDALLEIVKDQQKTIQTLSNVVAELTKNNHNR